MTDVGPYFVVVDTGHGRTWTRASLWSDAMRLYEAAEAQGYEAHVTREAGPLPPSSVGADMAARVGRKHFGRK